MKKLLAILMLLCTPAAAQNYLRDDGIFHSVVEGTTSGQALVNQNGSLTGSTIVIYADGYITQSSPTRTQITAGLNAAFAACGTAGGGTVIFGPRYLTNDTINMPQSCTLQGMGQGNGNVNTPTVIDFLPTADNKSAITISQGANIANFGGIKSLTIYSADTTFVKTAITCVDCRMTEISQVQIAGAGSGGAWHDTTNNSKGLWTQGRDGFNVHDSAFYADLPVYFGVDPNLTSYGGDQSNFRNMAYFSATNCLITFAGGQFNNMIFDGYQQGLAGTCGVQFLDTTTTVFNQAALVFKNFRFEQAISATSYCFDFEGHAAANVYINVTFDNITCDRYGYKLRNVSSARISNSKMLSGVGYDIDSSVYGLVLDNNFWLNGVTVNVTGQILSGVISYGVAGVTNLDASQTVPANGIYQNATGLVPTGTFGSAAFKGSSSGTATITAPAAAGTPTLTLPTASGTFVTSAASLTANQIVIGSGSQGEQTLGSLGTTTTLLHGNAGGAPTFGAAVSADLNITTTTCTNQFISAISATGIGTCTSVTAAETPLTNTHILVGNASNVAADVALSGDATISNTGALSIGATKITSAMLNADVFSTAHSWAGQQTFTAPILGTPASGTVTNLTGTASININGTVGATTPGTGAFTTVSASSTVSGAGFSTYLASPPAIGGTVAAAGTFTTLTGNTSVTSALFNATGASGYELSGTTVLGIVATNFTTLSDPAGTGKIFIGNATANHANSYVANTQIFKDVASGAVQMTLAAGLVVGPTGTDPGIGGILATGATIKFSALANVATTSALCYNTGTGLLTYDGTIGTCTVSDERLKNMGERIPDALARLLKINGVYYTWKDPASMGNGRQIGVGAQTVEAVFPELVQEDSSGYKSADYQRLTAPIIEAIRELHDEIQILKRGTR